MKPTTCPALPYLPTHLPTHQMTLHFEHLMSKSELKVYWGHHLSDLALSVNGFLQTVHLERRSLVTDAEAAETLRGHQVTVACVALLLCHTAPLPDKDVFTAINESGLVFDGGLVVDQSFRTVDPAIYGVSDYTKFSRMYKDALPHCRYAVLANMTTSLILLRHEYPGSTLASWECTWLLKYWSSTWTRPRPPRTQAAQPRDPVPCSAAPVRLLAAAPAARSLCPRRPASSRRPSTAPCRSSTCRGRSPPTCRTISSFSGALFRNRVMKCWPTRAPEKLRAENVF